MFFPSFLGVISGNGVGIPAPNSRLFQPLTYQVVTPPPTGVYAVPLPLVKEYLKIDATNTADDLFLTLAIEVATKIFEEYTNYILINTVFRTFADFFYPQYVLRRIPFVPTGINQGLTAFEYLVNSVWTAVANTNFYTTQEQYYSLVVFNSYEDIPRDKDDRRQSIRIDFTAGYGVDDSFVPADIKLGLLQLIAYFNENRGDCDACSCKGEGFWSRVPASVSAVFQKYRRLQIVGDSFRSG